MEILVVTSKELIGKEIEKVFDTQEAFAFKGTGLFTSICVSFANLFGASSTRFANKMDKAIQEAKQMLVNKAGDLGANAVIDYRIQHLGNAVCVYGTPVILK